jgi:hypothetical protein
LAPLVEPKVNARQIAGCNRAPGQRSPGRPFLHDPLGIEKRRKSRDTIPGDGKIALPKRFAAATLNSG